MQRHARHNRKTRSRGACRLAYRGYDVKGNTMKRTLAIIAALGLTACAAPTEQTPAIDFRLADGADLASTAAFLATDSGVEINPVLSGGSSAEILGGGLALKLSVRYAINHIPMSDSQRHGMHEFMNATGYGAFCNNIALPFAAKVEPVLVGGLCFGGYAVWALAKGGK